MKEYKWILKYFFKEQPFYILGILFLYILMYLMQPLELVLMQKIIKSLSGDLQNDYIIRTVIIFVIVFSLKNIQFSFSLLFIETLEFKITAALQKKLFTSIAKTELVNLDRSQYLLKVERAKDTVWYKLTNIINDCFHFIGSVVGLIATGVIIFKVGSIYLFLFILMGILQNIFARKNSKETISLLKSQESKHRVLNYYNQLIMDRTKIQEIRSYKLFNWIEAKRLLKYEQVENEHLNFSKRWMKINFFWTFLMLIIENSILVFVCYDVVKAILSLDQMILLTQSQRQIVNGIENIADFFSDMKKNAVYTSEYKELINERNETGSDLINRNKSSNLQFHNVYFCYKEGLYALKDINFNLKQGEIIALVGENGSGKSTLSKIAAGLMKPTTGTVTNGYNVRSATFQDYSKFEFSVQENVGLGNVHEINNFEKIKKAMIMAQSDNLIDQLEFGLNTILGKRFDESGVDISEGQWQKIAISRALMRDSDLIIFDEPAAALDPIAEKKQFNRMKENFTGKSVILVSHRVGIVKLADRILYMEKGQIVEEGSHNHLMKKDGKYKEFYLSQAKWYEEGELYEVKKSV